MSRTLALTVCASLFLWACSDEGGSDAPPQTSESADSSVGPDVDGASDGGATDAPSATDDGQADPQDTPETPLDTDAPVSDAIPGADSDGSGSPTDDTLSLDVGLDVPPEEPADVPGDALTIEVTPTDAVPGPTDITDDSQGPDAELPDADVTAVDDEGNLPTGCNGICGDLNQDGALDDEDLALLDGFVSGTATQQPDECAMAAGDLHQDGSLTEADLALLPVQVANGLTAACKPCDMICGDITGDAIADALDVEELTTIILNGPPYDACLYWGADTTKDGDLNVGDVNAIIAFINNGTPLTCHP